MEKHVGSEEQVASWHSWAASLRSHWLRVAEDEPQMLKSEIFYKGHCQSRMINSGADALDHCSSAKVFPPSGKHFSRILMWQSNFHPKLAAVLPSWHRREEKGEKQSKQVGIEQGICQERNSFWKTIHKTKNLYFAKIFHISLRESSM